MSQGAPNSNPPSGGEPTKNLTFEYTDHGPPSRFCGPEPEATSPAPMAVNSPAPAISYAMAAASAIASANKEKEARKAALRIVAFLEKKRREESERKAYAAKAMVERSNAIMKELFASCCGLIHPCVHDKYRTALLDLYRIKRSSETKLSTSKAPEPSGPVRSSSPGPAVNDAGEAASAPARLRDEASRGSSTSTGSPISSSFGSLDDFLENPSSEDESGSPQVVAARDTTFARPSVLQSDFIGTSDQVLSNGQIALNILDKGNDVTSKPHDGEFDESPSEEFLRGRRVRRPLLARTQSAPRTQSATPTPVTDAASKSHDERERQEDTDHSRGRQYPEGLRRPVSLGERRVLGLPLARSQSVPFIPATETTATTVPATSVRPTIFNTRRDPRDIFDTGYGAQWRRKRDAQHWPQHLWSGPASPTFECRTHTNADGRPIKPARPHLWLDGPNADPNTPILTKCSGSDPLRKNRLPIPENEKLSWGCGGIHNTVTLRMINEGYNCPQCRLEWSPMRFYKCANPHCGGVLRARPGSCVTCEETVVDPKTKERKICGEHQFCMGWPYKRRLENGQGHPLTRKSLINGGFHVWEFDPEEWYRRLSPNAWFRVYEAQREIVEGQLRDKFDLTRWCYGNVRLPGSPRVELMFPPTVAEAHEALLPNPTLPGNRPSLELMPQGRRPQGMSRR